ncbi:hypothetical protein BDL97_18G087000 [Sphagnum fallax]|nr:hypothetical protein BDL97_18G087000 [Sphagnum fallax]KAH8934503.1 hypothetical protein BDL97_18G087000 [Sphagnum fallax]KAH8934521.1 hypothetical protein BDL97_18G087000 [Sphagnum fallax]
MLGILKTWTESAPSFVSSCICTSSPFCGSATEHTATIIDGKAIARQVQQEIAVKVSKMKESVGKAPGLAVILVGTRKDSETYVQIKKKACEEVGFDFFGVKLPDNTTQDEILKFVKKFNDNPAVHGTQVQLPLPKLCKEGTPCLCPLARKVVSSCFFEQVWSSRGSMLLLLDAAILWEHLQHFSCSNEMQQ